MERDEKRFNYFHSATRICVERAFGLLKGRWRILKRPLNMKSPESIGRTIVACMVLHNLVIDANDSYEIQERDRIDIYLGSHSRAKSFLGRQSTSFDQKRSNQRVFGCFEQKTKWHIKCSQFYFDNESPILFSAASIACKSVDCSLAVSFCLDCIASNFDSIVFSDDTAEGLFSLDAANSEIDAAIVAKPASMFSPTFFAGPARFSFSCFFLLIESKAVLEI